MSEEISIHVPDLSETDLSRPTDTKIDPEDFLRLVKKGDPVAESIDKFEIPTNDKAEVRRFIGEAANELIDVIDDPESRKVLILRLKGLLVDSRREPEEKSEDPTGLLGDEEIILPGEPGDKLREIKNEILLRTLLGPKQSRLLDQLK